MLKTPGRIDRIARKSLAFTQEHSEVEATARGVVLALYVKSMSQDLTGFCVSCLAGFFPEGGVAARVFSAEKAGDKHESKKSHPDPHESKIRLLRGPGRERLQGPEFPSDNPPLASEPGAESNAGAVQSPYRQIKHRHA